LEPSEPTLRRRVYRNGLETGLFFVQNQADKQEIAELETLNAELMRSLARCRRFLFDGRSQLAANCNMPEMLDADPDATNA